MTKAARLHLTFLLLLTLALCRGVPAAHAVGYPGFGLGASRVVVMSDDRRSGQVMALNNSDNVYLVQSRVWPADGVTGYPLTPDGRKASGAAAAPADDKVSPPRVPFLVTPPLKRMGGWSTQQLRILVTPDNALPTDRESLFFLSSKAIPSDAPAKDDKAQAPRVSMALQSYIKLFYRPAGLAPRAIFDGTVAPHLTMSRVAGRLHVTNPTPYYLTFGVLTVGGKDVGPDTRRIMVPPKGTQDYPFPPGVTGGTVVWQLIDEFGLVTTAQQQKLS